MPSTKTEVVSTPQGHMAVTFHLVSKSDIGGTSGSKVIDPFSGMYSNSDSIISPPYSPSWLVRFPDICGALKNCIKTKARGVHGHGYELVAAPGIDEAILNSEKAKEQKRRAEMLLMYPNSNADESFSDIRKQMQEDKETIGYGAMEVVRNGAGEVAEIYHVPAHLLRLMQLDANFTDFEESVLTPDGKFEPVQRVKRFRRFVQIANGKRTYFKEFGDPRLISGYSGKEVASTQEEAHELLMFSHYAGYTPYGIPLWLPELMRVMGNYKSQKINLMYFDNKMIPPMVVTVAGGTLTDETYNRLQRVFENEIRGSDNFHKILFIQAEPFVGGDQGDDISNVKIDVKPLTEWIQDDGMFSNYQQENSEAIRESFQIPAILLGRSDEYNRATSFEATRSAEETAFSPEREDFDYTFNRTIMRDMQISYWRYKGKGPQTSDDAESLKAIATVKDNIPLAMIWELAAKVTGGELPQIPDEIRDLSVSQLRQQALMARATVGTPPKNPDGNQPPQFQKADDFERMIGGIVKVRDMVEAELAKRVA